MPNTPNEPDKEKPLLKLKNQKLFDKYRLAFEALPSYKKTLTTMIKFKNMYQPIVKPMGYADPFRRIKKTNELLQLKRTQVSLNRRDLVTTFDEVHGKRLVVTSRGHKIFYKDYPLAKLRDKPWGGVWTVVMYDFPEKERSKRKTIRRRLMRLGFGCPQISILISPLPIEGPIQKLLEGEGIADKVWTLRATRILGMENKEVAKKSWPMIDELNSLYQELLEVLSKVKKSKKLKEEWQSYFLAVNSADPYLPSELLPKDWKGEVCEQEFVKLGRAGFFKALFRNLI